MRPHAAISGRALLVGGFAALVLWAVGIGIIIGWLRGAP